MILFAFQSHKWSYSLMSGLRSRELSQLHSHFFFMWRFKRSKILPFRDQPVDFGIPWTVAKYSSFWYDFLYECEIRTRDGVSIWRSVFRRAAWCAYTHGWKLTRWRMAIKKSPVSQRNTSYTHELWKKYNHCRRYVNAEGDDSFFHENVAGRWLLTGAPQAAHEGHRLVHPADSWVSPSFFYFLSISPLGNRHAHNDCHRDFLPAFRHCLFSERQSFLFGIPHAGPAVHLFPHGPVYRFPQNHIVDRNGRPFAGCGNFIIQRHFIGSRSRTGPRGACPSFHDRAFRHCQGER